MKALDFSQFHDGYLTGVQLGEGMATFLLAREDGRAFDLVLSDLKSLQIEDFRQGNIINHIGTFDGTAPEDAAYIERLFGSPHPGAAAQYHEANAGFIARQLASVRCEIVIASALNSPRSGLPDARRRFPTDAGVARMPRAPSGGTGRLLLSIPLRGLHACDPHSINQFKLTR